MVENDLFTSSTTEHHPGHHGTTTTGEHRGEGSTHGSDTTHEGATETHGDEQTTQERNTTTMKRTTTPTLTALTLALMCILGSGTGYSPTDVSTYGAGGGDTRSFTEISSQTDCTERATTVSGSLPDWSSQSNPSTGGVTADLTAGTTRYTISEQTDDAGSTGTGTVVMVATRKGTKTTGDATGTLTS